MRWDDNDKMLVAAMIKNFPGVWRPIETAPKDGTKIDVWVVKTYTADAPLYNAKAGDVIGRREIDVVWQSMPWDGGRWARRGGDLVDYELVSVVVGWISATEVITHWMPQPGAPT